MHNVLEMAVLGENDGQETYSLTYLSPVYTQHLMRIVKRITTNEV